MQPLIVYCGFDGTGKTTAAQFRSKRIKGSVLLHSHQYSTSSNSFGLNEITVRKLGYILMPIVLWAVIDNLITYHKIHKRIRQHRTLICDRYFYDKVARMMYYGVCPKWLAKIWIKKLPKPTECYILTKPYVIKPEITDIPKWEWAYNFVKGVVNETS